MSDLNHLRPRHSASDAGRWPRWSARWFHINLMLVGIWLCVGAIEAPMDAVVEYVRHGSIGVPAVDSVVSAGCASCAVLVGLAHHYMARVLGHLERVGTFLVLCGMASLWVNFAAWLAGFL